MASDFLDNLREICRPDGKAGRLSALLGTIDEASLKVHAKKDAAPMVLAELCLCELSKIILAKHQYDEAI